MANSRCGRPSAFSPAISGVSNGIRPTGSRFSIFENTRLTSRGGSLRYIEPQRTALTAAEAVARKPDARSFPRGKLCECRYFCRFFDIVGKDEGTCGRRLAVSGLLKGSGYRSKLSRSHMSFTYSICNGRSFWCSHRDGRLNDIVQSGSLRWAG
jgi:hypothetical protein